MNRHVERRRRLVGDQHWGRQAIAMAMTIRCRMSARELVRKTRVTPSRRNADVCERGECLQFRLVPAEPEMSPHVAAALANRPARPRRPEFWDGNTAGAAFWT